MLLRRVRWSGWSDRGFAALIWKLEMTAADEQRVGALERIVYQDLESSDVPTGTGKMRC